jgi:hypothetical protein
MIEKLNELANQPTARKFLYFDEMITPTLIRIGYWLSLVVVLFAGLGRAFDGGIGNFISGLVFIVAGAIIVRVLAELVILAFKIQEDIETVAKNSASKPVTAKKVSKKTSKKVSKKA